MKIYISTLAVLAFSISALAVNYKDLDSLGLDKKMQQQLLDVIELQQSIQDSIKVLKGVGLGSIVTVGTENSCDFFVGATPIQDAIDSGATEIRIADDMAHIENLEINDQSIILKGGYADCAAAVSDTQFGTTTINGVLPTTGFPVIRILGNTERHTIVLDSLSLTRGSGTGWFPGGGISTIGADAQINITNSLISSNTGTFGGGIAIVAGDTDITLTDTIVTLNTAGLGGGIYCSGLDASVLMSGNSGVSGNTADGSAGSATSSGKGGGLFIESQCEFNSFSGTAGGFFDFRGIAANTATDQGGGIFARDGATVNLWGFQFCFFSCIGDNTNPANLNGNRAESDGVGMVGFRAGSGAFITGTDTSLAIVNGRVTGNNVGAAGADGGAIYADAGATFTTSRIGKACWDQEKCNYYANNASGSDAGYGGAFFNRESTMNITNAVIENNRADVGTVLYTTGTGAVSTIKGSLIHSNGDSGTDDFNDGSVFRVFTDARLNIHHSTIADNNATDAVFRIHVNAATGSQLYSSIVHDASSGIVFTAGSGDISVDCSILHELASNPDADSPMTVVDDPEFIDRANGDYHIHPTLSPAVDACGDFGTGPVDYRDMDFEEFGFDDPTVAGSSSFDVGADETYANDIIFKNGFEM
ncbi:MAG: hypothetical protein L3J53_05590 [Proteobacteria bacterium]|nr:hypothetical protein [Pseudomonadota bacterium]